MKTKKVIYFFPIAFKSMNLSLTIDEVESIVKKNIHPPSWRLNRENISNHYILEGIVYPNRFVIVHGRYGLTYGKTSLLPRLYGFFFSNKRQGDTRIRIIIRPGTLGLMIYSCFLIAAGLILHRTIQSGQTSGIIVVLGLIIVTYASLMLKFNKEVVEYDNFVKNNLLLAQKK